MGSDSHLQRGRRPKASWEPLGALLEALGAEKVIGDRLLGGQEAHQDEISAHKLAVGQTCGMQGWCDRRAVGQTRSASSYKAADRSRGGLACTGRAVGQARSA